LLSRRDNADNVLSFCKRTASDGLQHARSDVSDFSVIAAVIRHVHKRAFKKAAGIGKINPVLNDIGEPLFFVPFKISWLQCIYIL